MANPAAASAPAPAAAPAAPARSKGKLVVIIAAVSVVFAAVGGGAAWFFLSKGGDASHAEAKKEAPKKDPMFLPLEIFTVNLADTDADRYAQVGVTLAVADSNADAVVKAHMPIIRSAILLQLSGKRASDLATAADKAKLAEEIAETVRGPLPLSGPAKGIEGVYFSTLIVQ